MNRKYGWKKQLPDSRDYKLATRIQTPAVELPVRFHLYANQAPIYDQGQLGSCTANAAAGCYEYQRNIQKLGDWMPSRLFIYYNERVLEGTTGTDAGADLRDGFKTMNQLGCAMESSWPYSAGAFAAKPPTYAYSEALQNKIAVYAAVAQTPQDIKTAIVARHPIAFGFNVYDSFESNTVAATGVVPMPDTANEQLLGGHAVVIVGYDDHYQAYMVRNSWGESWGDSGYCFMPYDYIHNPALCSDFWVIDSI